MDNPEKLASLILGTQDTGQKKKQKNTTQKSKRMSNTDLYISLIVIKDPPNHLRRDRKPEVYPLF